MTLPRWAGQERLFAVARAIMLGALRDLPAEHAERWREEWDADLAELRDCPRAALDHALRAATCAHRLTRALGGPAPRPRDPLHRRALAHLGLPVTLAAPQAQGDASYVFDGAMRWQRADGAAVLAQTSDDRMPR